jgi:hypothetical protein
MFEQKIHDKPFPNVFYDHPLNSGKRWLGAVKALNDQITG